MLKTIKDVKLCLTHLLLPSIVALVIKHIKAKNKQSFVHSKGLECMITEIHSNTNFMFFVLKQFYKVEMALSSVCFKILNH